MKQLLAGSALFLSSLIPSAASARAVEDVTLDADANDIVLTVASDEALHAPTVRTYPGVIRVRFYDAHNTPTLRVSGDGGAVRTVDLGSGSDQSAALVLVLGDRTKLAPTDVRVERDAHKVVFKIARGLLPALHGGTPMPVHAKAVEAPQPKPAAHAQVAPHTVPAPVAEAAAPAAMPAPVAAPVASAAPVAAAPTPPAAATAQPKERAPVNALGAKKAPEKKPEESELKMAKNESSAMPVLLAVSALLALAYAAMRFMMKKNLGSDIPAIDIIAQKRLGARHQLVIVRAFDRDYLLSIQGNQTTVVARSSRKKAEGEAGQESPLAMLPMTATALGAAKRAAPAGRDFEDDEPTFGGELFKTALEQREKAREQTASFRLEAARAEARAELARLDAAREELASSVEPSEAPNFARELAREEERSAESEAITNEVPGAMSDSVSGLLRLRKASGR